MSTLIVAAAALVALGIFVSLAYLRQWQWTGLPASRAEDDGASARSARTLWDWLQLLGIPVALAALAFLINDAQTRREERREDQRAAQQRRTAADSEREGTLRAYLTQMSELMLEGDLLRSRPGSDVRNVARTATLTALRRLDGSRRGLVVGFLSEAGLLRRTQPANAAPVDIAFADLSEADLSGVASLSRANLRRANLRGANFGEAILTNADLSMTNLRGANFRESNLRGANFEQADLGAANLTRAYLRSALLPRATLRRTDLTGADLGLANLSHADLSGANLSSVSLVGAVLIGANLHDAILRGTIINNADFRSVTGTKLAGARGTPAFRP